MINFLPISGNFEQQIFYPPQYFFFFGGGGGQQMTPSTAIEGSKSFSLAHDLGVDMTLESIQLWHEYDFGVDMT